MTRFTRAGRVVACLSLIAAGVLASGRPAAAAKSPPWRWVKVSQLLYVSHGTSNSAELFCPFGYVPVFGGMNGDGEGALNRMREYPDPWRNSYVFTVRNTGSQGWYARLVAWCAHADDVGPITIDSKGFPEDANGRAGGLLGCPENTGLLSGGADWDTTGTRRIDYSGPNPLGNAWFATGSSAAVNDTLVIEIRCIPNSSLTGQQTVIRTVDFISSNVNIARVTCPSGTRVMTGGSWARHTGSGIFDTKPRGYSYKSYPDKANSWWGEASVGSPYTTGSQFTSIAHCIPVSKPVVELTQVPAQHSPNSSGHFAFSAYDPAAESLTAWCSLDGRPPTQCQSPVPYGPIGDGFHRFEVSVTNTSEQTTTRSYDWFVDTDAPTVTIDSPNPDQRVNGVVSIDADADDDITPTDDIEVRFSYEDPDGGGPQFIGSDGTSPFSYSWDTTSVPEGDVTLTATATDLAGNSSSASVPIAIDRTPPTITFTSGPHRVFTPARNATFNFATTDGQPAAFSCRLDGDAFAPCTAPHTVSGLAAGDHSLAVMGTDSANNVGESSTRIWNVPHDDAELIHEGAWTQTTGSGHLLRTISVTRDKGALLRLRSPAKSVALVATKCPDCGTVAVYAGSELLKTVRLGSDTVQKKRVIAIRGSSETIRGPIKVVVASDGEKVMIDGLGISTSF